jgi:hypothetical protein
VNGKVDLRDRPPAYSENGIPKYTIESYQKAVPCWIRAAELDHVMSLKRLGEVYSEGKSGTVDFEKAMSYWLRATELGDKESIGKIEKYYNQVESQLSDALVGKLLVMLANDGNLGAQLHFAARLLKDDKFSEAKKYLIMAKEQGSDKASKALEDLALMEKQQNAITAEKAKQDAEKQAQLDRQEVLRSQQLSEITKREHQFAMYCKIVLVVLIISAIIGIIMGLKGKVYIYNNVFDVVLSGIFVVLIAVTLGLYSNGNDDYKGILYFTIFVGLAVSFNSYRINKSFLKQLVVVPAKMFAILILLFSVLISLAALSLAIKAEKKESNARELVEKGVKSAQAIADNVRKEKLQSFAMVGIGGAVVAFSFRLIKKLIKSKNVAKSIE